MIHVLSALDSAEFDVVEMAETADFKHHGSRYVVREHELNPKVLRFSSPFRDDGGTQVSVDVGMTGKLTYGYFVNVTDFFILALHGLRPAGAVRSCGHHLLWFIQGTDIQQISWAAKKRRFGSDTKVMRLTLLVAAPAPSEHTLEIEIGLHEPLKQMLGALARIAYESRGADYVEPSTQAGSRSLMFDGSDS